MPGLLYMRLAQIDERGEDDAAAQRELERAVENFDATHNRGLPRALALLARLELQRGELQPARAHAERAVQVARERLEGFDRSSWLGVALVAQGLVQQRLGDEATARQTWRAALDHLQPCLGDDAPDTLEARRLLGLPARDMSAAARASDAVSG